MSGIPTTHQNLVSLDLRKLLEWVKSKDGVPTLWMVLRRIAIKRRQQVENTKKDPSMSLLMIIAQLSYSHSSHNNHVPQLFATYFQAIRMPSKAFEVLHQLGVCMSQRWAEQAVKRLANDAISRMSKAIHLSSYVITGDNINIYSQVFSQRVHNQNS
ncbi:hypothetical protein FRB99_009037 [Tulasnella sp. 403]|nr:hypothetical protein FRB99_009037 [Tulasnella sp. 403]